MHPYQAKFRVKSKTEGARTEWIGGRPTRIPVVIIEFYPVNAKNAYSDDPNASVENARFWEATPTGSAEIAVTPEQAASYAVDQAFYIDFHRDSAGTWTRGVSSLFTGGLELVLHPLGAQGHLKLNVQRAETVLALLDDIATPMQEALSALVAKGETNGYNLPADRWSVTFTPAPG